MSDETPPEGPSGEPSAPGAPGATPPPGPGTYQVFPAQVEEHLCELKDKVAACGVVGVTHEIFSEGIVAFVEPQPDVALTEEELKAHAKGLAGYMRPSHYIILGAGELPLNRVAKTDYVTLKDQADAAVAKLREAGGWDT